MLVVAEGVEMRPIAVDHEDNLLADIGRAVGHALQAVDRATNICEQIIFMIDGDWPHFDTLRDNQHQSEPVVLDTED